MFFQFKGFRNRQSDPDDKFEVYKFGKYEQKISSKSYCWGIFRDGGYARLIEWDEQGFPTYISQIYMASTILAQKKDQGWTEEYMPRDHRFSIKEINSFSIDLPNKELPYYKEGEIIIEKKECVNSILSLDLSTE